MFCPAALFVHVSALHCSTLSMFRLTTRCRGNSISLLRRCCCNLYTCFQHALCEIDHIVITRSERTSMHSTDQHDTSNSVQRLPIASSCSSPQCCAKSAPWASNVPPRSFTLCRLTSLVHAPKSCSTCLRLPLNRSSGRFVQTTGCGW